MKTFVRLFFLLIVVNGFITSCGNDDKDGHIEYVNTEILKMMKDIYLWNDYLPNRVDPADYSTPAGFMEALRYTQFDKWSTVLTVEDFNAYFTEGRMIGHGFMVGLDQNDNFRIAFVYRSTEAEEKGVKRGWILSKVNGTTVTLNNFGSVLGKNELGIKNNITFINESSEELTLELSKEEINLTPVLHYEIIDQGDSKIGYMVFQDFIETANQEIDEVFDSFSTAGITELIVDMRYNGGGDVKVAEHLAGWIIGKDFAGEPFLYYEHNRLLREQYNMDTMYTVPAKANGFSFDRVFFIGTSNTASASELIINGMKPFISTYMAGSTTHGKPVGMYAIPIEDYVTLPVTFKYSNKNHSGEFYDGIAAEIAAEDDITRNWGDPQEASLKAILDFIQSGTITGKSTKSTAYPSRIIETGKPLGQFLRAF